MSRRDAQSGDAWKRPPDRERGYFVAMAADFNGFRRRHRLAVYCLCSALIPVCSQPESAGCLGLVSRIGATVAGSGQSFRRPRREVCC